MSRALGVPQALHAPRVVKPLQEFDLTTVQKDERSSEPCTVQQLELANRVLHVQIDGQVLQERRVR